MGSASKDLETAAPGQRRAPDASMSLLREIMDKPLDGGYSQADPQHLTSRRKRSWLQEVIVLVLTIAIGAGGVWAARQLRTPVDSALEARVVLQEQITDRSQTTEDLRQEIEDLRTEISDLQSRTNTPADQQRAEFAERAAIHAGVIATAGPGVEITLTDSSRASAAEDYVLDIDLQIVANGLWAAGAEAISINDHRLAYGTAIRTAGKVILVDLEPVQSPYVVHAIGDPERLLRAFAQTPAADHLNILNSAYRIKSSLVQHPHLEMRAGLTLRLNYAETM